MAGVSGRGTTYNLPNYHGDLISLTPEDTPFLSAIGGLNGGQSTTATEFEWSTYDLRAAASDRQRLEGADAPTADTRVRANISNLVEIHQETIDVSYTKQAAVGAYGGINAQGGVNTPNPVTNEVAFQTDAALRAKALDAEKTFIDGVYQKPSDNTTARKTRGIIEATSSANITFGASAGAVQTGTAAASTDKVAVSAHGYNDDDMVAFTVLTGGTGLRLNYPYWVVSKATNDFKVALTKGGTPVDITVDYSAVSVCKLAAATKTDVDVLLQTVWGNGGIREQAAATLMVGASAKRNLTKLFITDANYREVTRDVGGVSVQTIETDFGRLNVVLSRFMPDGAYQVVSLDQCAPVFLEVPGKGLLFVEPIAKIGASERYQLYGELGLKYGSPAAHGRLLALGL